MWLECCNSPGPLHADDCPLDIKRHYNRDLIGLNENGALCEVCNRHMHLHIWADLDPQGFVVNCDFSRIDLSKCLVGVYNKQQHQWSFMNRYAHEGMIQEFAERNDHLIYFILIPADI